MDKKLQAIFFAEAEELIADLEQALLQLEAEPQNITGVQEVFRVMHTLKGSASMFGFDSLSALTHDLETIYDSVRAGTMELSVEILQVTLECVDHLKNLIKDPDLKDSLVKGTHASLLERIHELSSGERKQVESASAAVNIAGSLFYILLRFKAGIFSNGTNPLYLVDDLTNLGQNLVYPHLDEVPALHSINPDISYVSFELLLFTAQGEDSIREVFIFCEDQVELQVEKLGNDNLLNDKDFVQALGNPLPEAPPFGYALVKSIAVKTQVKTQLGSILPGQGNKGLESTSIRVSSDKLDELMNLVSELVTSQARLTLIAEKNSIADLVNLSENMEKITRRLRDNAFTICLVPIESLVTRFQRLVRDLSKELKKEIEFIAEGTETELDKSIIENVTDPILHILRNCIDHGIELPEERVRKGKSRKGRIELKAYHSGTSVFIQIRDDGKGINIEKIRSKAIGQGLIQAENTLSDKEILDLVFKPGFSLAEKVTDVSGRGVGMDIVKQKIDTIHGEVSLQSKVDEGTTLTIKLPLTLSIMDGMLVRIGKSSYVLPLSMVEKCFEIATRQLEKRVIQKHVFDGELVPVFNLLEAFCEDGNTSEITQVIKIRYEEFPVAITVDAIIGEYQAVMKPLGEMYRGQDEFSGGTILGDGSVALVFDTDKLIRKFIQLDELSTVSV